MYYIRLCFYKFFVYGLNVIDQILCHIYSNFKIFPKLTDTSPKWRHSLDIYICLRVNATKLCITSVCVFISSWCMAWMLSIKYFVLLTQILRFSLNWRTHLQNGVILWYLLLRQVNATTVCITFVCVFFSFLMYGLNVIDQILCHIYSNFKIFPKLTGTSPKWRHLYYLFYARSMPLRFLLHPFVFFSVLWCMAWMLSIKYFVFFNQILRFSLNWRTHLQNGVFFGILFYVRSITLRFVLHPFVFFSSSLCMAWVLSIKYFVFFAEIIRISLNWRTHLQNWRHLWNFIWVRSMPLRFVLHPFVFL